MTAARVGAEANSQVCFRKFVFKCIVEAIQQRREREGNESNLARKEKFLQE